jgi:hypothetical protein
MARLSGDLAASFHDTCRKVPKHSACRLWLPEVGYLWGLAQLVEQNKDLGRSAQGCL